MATKNRTLPSTYIVTGNVDRNYFLGNRFVEGITSVRYAGVGGSACYHSRIWPYSGPFASDPGTQHVVANYDFGLGPRSHGYEKRISELWNSLDTKEMISSNQFSLIAFFAELDDSLAIFTQKFARELSYGSFSWGIVPFVTEMRSLLQQVVRLEEAMKAIQRFEDRIIETLSGERVIADGGYTFSVSTKVTLGLSGWVDTGSSLGDQAKRFLDILGFHPDISTVWDLVPLSFVVDWILPVGDFLASLHNRGWVSDPRFRGWKTLKVESSFQSDPSIKPGVAFVYDFKVEAKEFYRCFVWDFVDTESYRPQIRFELPSLRELFNLFYLFILPKVKKRKKS